MIPFYAWPLLVVGALSTVVCAAIVLFVVLVERYDERQEIRRVRRTLGDREVERLEQQWDLVFPGQRGAYLFKDERS